VKPLAIWLVIVAVVFGGYALVASLLDETEQVFVAVDASQPMLVLNNDVIVELDRIDDQDGAEFALATISSQRSNTALVHSWQPELRWTNTPLFGRCSFDDIESFGEATEADDRILITTAGSCDTSTLADWTIVELTP
jgi:hypothetical protein